MKAEKETDAMNAELAELTDDMPDAVNGGGRVLPPDPPQSDSGDIVE